MLSVGALWYYSVWFKKKVLVGNVLVALLAALVPFVAGVYEVVLQQNNFETLALGSGFRMKEFDYVFGLTIDKVMVWVLGFALFAFLSTMVREIVKDIEDYEGDKKYNSNTLPVVYGKKKGGLVAQIFAVIIIVLIGILQYRQMQGENLKSILYFLITIQLPMIYVVYQLKHAKEKVAYSRLSVFIKLIMLFVIVYTGLLYYSTTSMYCHYLD